MRHRPHLASGLAVFAVVGLLATGCSSSGTPAPKAESTEAPVRADADLVIWTSQEHAAMLKPFAASFGEENGISVEVQPISGELRATYVTATNSGKGPDILMTASDAIGNLVQNDAIDPLNLSADQLAAYQGVAVNAMTYNEQVYGVPYAIDNVALFRNTDFVPAVPATMEELVTTGQQLVDAGSVENVLSLPVGQNGDSYHLQPLFTGAGGYLFGTNADGTYNPDDLGLESPESIAAMTTIQGLANQGVLSTSIDADNSISLFAEGKTPFMVSGGWAIEALKEAGVNYEITAVPGFGGGTAKPFVGVQGLYISSKATNKSFAQEFVTNFIGSDVDTSLAFSAASGRPSAVTEAFVQQSATDADIKGLGDAGVLGQPSPTFPAMAVVWDPLSKAEAAIIGGADPASTLAAAAATIRQQIADAN
ncbi:extracellular solute-binding protein [Mycetocola sp. 2940]|uniref:sugar ABC transporter substrate-binding protein n=1 Tax=Mycetocola sp. 2940 TaxID=3156452 RepID=UPI00339AD1F2